MKIAINYDSKVISMDDKKRLALKISAAENNGLSYGSSNKVMAKKGPDGTMGTGGTSNLPGNGIDGIVGQGIGIVRCNKTVSTKVDLKCDQFEYINAHKVIEGLLNKRALNKR